MTRSSCCAARWRLPALRSWLSPTTATSSHRLRFCCRYLRHAAATNRPGVNIFIHGAPGTGKSQLARILAQELGCELFEIASEGRRWRSGGRGAPVLPCIPGFAKLLHTAAGADCVRRGGRCLQ
ncbi:MAG: AAA family ATPase [Giesbergeria sp.]